MCRRPGAMRLSRVMSTRWMFTISAGGFTGESADAAIAAGIRSINIESAEELQRVLVELIDVGVLLAVDLDVDEPAVHVLRGRRVLEGLMGHDVAPVAGGVAD